MSDGILLMMRPAGWPWSSLSIHFRAEPAVGSAGIDLRAHLDLMSSLADAPL